MPDKSHAFIPTRTSLLTRLKHWDDQEGWKRFFDTYWRLIYSVACKAGLGDAEAQDVVQETIIGVAKKMPEFKYDRSVGSFKGWLLQLTRWRIADHVRKRQYKCRGEKLPREETLDTTIAEREADTAGLNLEAIWDEEWRKHLMKAAMERAKKLVSPTQFQMFHLHIVKNMPAKDVARHLEVKLPEVYFAKYKVGRLVQEGIKELEQSMI